MSTATSTRATSTTRKSKSKSNGDYAKVPTNDVGSIQRRINKVHEHGDKIVLEARNRKVQKLKLANQEAQKDINEYKAMREDLCDRLQAESVTWREELKVRVESNTQQELRALKELVEATREKALTRLLEVTLHIQPELHINLRL